MKNIFFSNIGVSVQISMWRAQHNITKYKTVDFYYVFLVLHEYRGTICGTRSHGTIGGRGGDEASNELAADATAAGSSNMRVTTVLNSIIICCVHAAARAPCCADAKSRFAVTCRATRVIVVLIMQFSRIWTPGEGMMYSLRFSVRSADSMTSLAPPHGIIISRGSVRSDCRKRENETASCLANGPMAGPIQSLLLFAELHGAYENYDDTIVIS